MMVMFVDVVLRLFRVLILFYVLCVGIFLCWFGFCLMWKIALNLGTANTTV